MTMTPDIHFETKERKVYPRTFLNTVFVIFDYETAGEPADLILLVQRFVKENFNLEIVLTDEEYNKGFSIDNIGAGHSYYFARGSVGVKYMGDNYVSFAESMMPLVYRLVAFMKNVISVPSISNVRIRKVNTFNAREHEDAPASKDKMIHDILSPELVAVARPSADYLGLQNVKEISGSTDGDAFEIHFGFHLGTAPDGSKFVGLVLDESVASKQVALNQVDEALRNVNDKVFNMFHWSINSNVLVIMSKEI